ncbi:MAG: hypothetical protein H0W72_06375 [Planctomycetes bacterium]|nr:hypothetical protein [Planctomycetota bacterium]
MPTPIRQGLALIAITVALGGCYQSSTHVPDGQAPDIPRGRQNGGSGPSGAPGVDAPDRSDTAPSGATSPPAAAPAPGDR